MRIIKICLITVIFFFGIMFLILFRVDIVNYFKYVPIYNDTAEYNIHLTIEEGDEYIKFNVYSNIIDDI